MTEYSSALQSDEQTEEVIKPNLTANVVSGQLTIDLQQKTEDCVPAEKHALLDVIWNFNTRLVYLWEAKVAIHALLQSLLLYAFSGIAEYPLKFTLSPLPMPAIHPMAP
eukprot:TRINITY_DN9445_c0_g1_i3.p1 TRINITY_DN9445_c0_g1~~TRINITY_DN9445_c0_g1_i3.p1  ORF type:complete len:109 (+),score=5.23 TRINITY_DN9445_c0_g1_i3:98-424(+)